MLKGMITNNHDIEYWKKEYLELSKDNDKLEQRIQQYKQQIDKLKHKIQLLQMDGEVEVRDLQMLLKILKERDEK